MTAVSFPSPVPSNSSRSFFTPRLCILPRLDEARPEKAFHSLVGRCESLVKGCVTVDDLNPCVMEYMGG